MASINKATIIGFVGQDPKVETLQTGTKVASFSVATTEKGYTTQGGTTMIHFVGAGSGGADLITVRGARLLGEADCIIYAGSLVNPDGLQYKSQHCAVYDSAGMTMEDVIAVMAENEKAEIIASLSDPSGKCDFAALQKRLNELETTIDDATMQWENAASALETLMTEYNAIANCR